MNNKGLIIAGIVIALIAGVVLIQSRSTQAPADTQMEQATEASPTAPAAMEASGTPETTDSESMEANVKEFTVEGSNMKFSETEMKVKEGDTVRITFKNVQGTHDWKLDEFNAATKVLEAGQEETIEFVADKAGTYEYYCSVGKHREMGMKGAFIVE